MTSTTEEQAPPGEAAGPAPAVRLEAEPSSRARLYGLLGGIAAFVLLLILPTPEILTPEAQRTAAVVALMGIWWMTEAIPLAATSLVPLVLFPVLGVLTPTAAAAPYSDPVIYLFLGGFVLALAMQRWELHRRIALAVVSVVGVGPRQLVLGFMVATAVVSMWVSNTATAAMMLPIGIAIVEVLRPRESGAPYPFATALMLGIAYAATIGGIGTLIGTPPNAVFAAAASEILGREIGFVDWMLVGVPVAAVFLPLTWALLVFVLFRPGDLPEGADEVLRRQRHELGPITRPEALVMGVFTLTVVGWLVREPKLIGGFRIPGLTDVIPGVHDATIAIFGALLLFLLPSGRRDRTRLMDWETAKRLPWGVLLLFGGGLSLARAFETSGLNEAVGEVVTGMVGVPGWLLLATVAATFIVLSEFASNTAIAAMAMPVVAAAAIGLGADPILFMATSSLASSAAFMMPVGTPPNTIAFGTGYIRITQMMWAGIWLNILSIIIMTLAGFLLVRPFLS
ncbi:MAG TPA: DASS family sodium-coupled anion symporter [Longimicrobiales bacterium]|nr:DASS family sodium-coupled anion symporter [Longimicrobiales bacterium]